MRDAYFKRQFSKTKHFKKTEQHVFIHNAPEARDESLYLFVYRFVKEEASLDFLSLGLSLHSVVSGSFIVNHAWVKFHFVNYNSQIIKVVLSVIRKL